MYTKNLMISIGVLAIVIGILGLLYCLSLDTSVSVSTGYRTTERVHNIGLMNEKQNYIIVCGVFSLIGAIFISIGFLPAVNKTKKTLVDDFEDRWNTLVKYDERVQTAISQLKSCGPSAIDKLKQAFHAINDLSQLEKITDNILQDENKNIQENEKKEKELWKESVKQNTIAAYQKYLKDSSLKHKKTEAENKIDELFYGDLMTEWRILRANPNIAGLEKFIEICPSIKIKAEAQELIDERLEKRLHTFMFWIVVGIGILSAMAIGMQCCEKNPIIPVALKTITIPLANLPSDAKPLEMVLIPAGTFTMGSPSNEKDRYSDEGPQHQVTITKPFYIGKYKVTQAQWKAVMGNNPSSFKGMNCPVEQVSWNDCQKFIQKLNQKGKDEFRLPTEAEWEYSCRAKTSKRFYWGDDPNYRKIDQYAWHEYNSGNATHDVGLKKPNPWGLYDMGGNVSEWCHDWYGDYQSSDIVDPGITSPSKDGSRRVIRGGCWAHYARYCRSARRIGRRPVDTYADVGFRLALSRT